ncbi:uncharacterized protein LOC119073186 [Bradysia coprophila]|uniref:uncharacterized protein LOC119073186 n=1 Tax=Bradysia coprophila TaxID=38358 RepID=UPI00187D8890|nr:uncharacterized protein LOC119073186 [Bradysia coprophila]
MEVMQQIPILLMIMSAQILGWRPFTVQFLNERYEIYHPDIINFNLTIKNASYIDLTIDILREISQLYIDFEDLHDSGNGTFDMVFMNRTVNICLFLNNRKSNPIFAIMFQMFALHLDIPKRCPLRKKRYEVMNVFIDPDKYPPFMTDHKAKILANVWNGRNGRNGKKKYLIKLTFNVVIERSFKGTVGP